MKASEGLRRYQRSLEGTRRYPKVPEVTRMHSKVTRRYPKVPEGTRRRPRLLEGHSKASEGTRRSLEDTRGHPKALECIRRHPKTFLVTSQPLENLSSRRHTLGTPLTTRCPASRGTPLTCSKTEVPPGSRGRLALLRVPGLDGVSLHPPVAPQFVSVQSAGKHGSETRTGNATRVPTLQCLWHRTKSIGCDGFRRS